MKKIIVLAAIAFFWLGQYAYASGGLIPLDRSYSEQSAKINSAVTGSRGAPENHTVEEGQKNGRKYRFFHSDGSGTFSGDRGNDISYLRYPHENWSVRCKRDPMDDLVSCSGTRGDLFIYYSAKTGFLIDLVGSKYPGSKITIRVGSEKPVSASEATGLSAKQSEQILQSIGEGSKVSTRYVDWPYGTNVDKTSDVYGLAVVMDYFRWVVDVAK